ncbi:GNAT family N-acetyltransferase [Roseomonas sp. E05]|uniref:GNAT family N-acetyltransferase n=1 Tax=Roseomonas sp. E05 TaxID=3046310 RepID=UPI0024BA43C6|nr:GNAT family N-acetyltransferase [Roseomonas sp. E05]MDJ0390146.1 GNAT family N-acetyltransferase [Roseomonas sp. E05]
MSGHCVEAEVALRPLTADDLEAARGLSQAVGWPHRLEDWRFVQALGSGLAAERAGRLLGTVMGWHFGTGYAALGMVIVAPEAQGQGLGRRLTAAAVAALEGRGILLHATAAGQPLYASLGFVTSGEVWKHEGVVAPAGPAVPGAGERLRPAERRDATMLAALDQAATGLDRAPLIAALLAGAEAVVLEREGGPAGFAMLRRFGRGWTVGPVVAPDAAAAQALVAHWLAACGGRALRIDVPAESGLSPWLRAWGLQPAGAATAMRRGPAPASGGVVHRFALVNQALG